MYEPLVDGGCKRNSASLFVSPETPVGVDDDVITIVDGIKP